MPRCAQVTFASGTFFSASAQALMTKSFTESFHAGLPSSSMGASALMALRASSNRSMKQSTVR